MEARLSVIQRESSRWTLPFCRADDIIAGSIHHDGRLPKVDGEGGTARALLFVVEDTEGGRWRAPAI